MTGGSKFIRKGADSVSIGGAWQSVTENPYRETLLFLLELSQKATSLGLASA